MLFSLEYFWSSLQQISECVPSWTSYCWKMGRFLCFLLVLKKTMSLVGGPEWKIRWNHDWKQREEGGDYLLSCLPLFSFSEWQQTNDLVINRFPSSGGLNQFPDHQTSQSLSAGISEPDEKFFPESWRQNGSRSKVEQLLQLLDCCQTECQAGRMFSHCSCLGISDKRRRISWRTDLGSKITSGFDVFLRLEEFPGWGGVWEENESVRFITKSAGGEVKRKKPPRTLQRCSWTICQETEWKTFQQTNINIKQRNRNNSRKVDLNALFCLLFNC